MKYKEQLFDAMSDIDADLIDIKPRKAAKATHLRHKKWLTAPIAAAMAVMLTLGVAAAGAAAVIKLLNEPAITENNLQLTEVPEGYVGIYSVADLVQINRDLQLGCAASNYILMEDITFTDADYAPGGLCEGGFIPIGYEQAYYTLETGEPVDWPLESALNSAVYLKKNEMQPIEVFNGNGHVIRNLQINLDICIDEETSAFYFTDEVSVGLFAGYTDLGNFSNVNIINLGIEGMNIRIKDDEGAGVRSLSVGGIAGTCRYIGACYVKDISVDVEVTLKDGTDNGVYESYGDLYYRIGGVVGKAQYVDAGYAEDYKMTVTVNGRPASCFYGGGLAGEAELVLTSWSQGTWEVSGEFLECEYGDFVSDSWMQTVPDAITPQGYTELCEKLEAYFGEEQKYEMEQVLFHYVNMDLNILSGVAQEELKVAMDQWNKLFNLATDQPEGTYHSALYIFDPTTDELERIRYHALLVEVLGGEEQLRLFCLNNSLTAGAVKCALPTEDGTYAGFDFEHLWILKDGIPRLKIFE